MSILKDAPLIEAIFELRWGRLTQQADGAVSFQFGEEDINFFFGQFKKVAADAGLAHHERANPFVPVVSPPPHVVIHRFMQQPNSWPCYQVGLGVFTANQVNEGYDWPSFKGAILRGLDLLERGHPLGLKGLMPIGAELKYQDAFFLDKEGNDIEFFKRKLDIGLTLPADLLQHPNLTPGVTLPSLAMSFQSNTPKGVLLVDIKKALINGRSGFLMETVLRSAEAQAPRFNAASLSTWLDGAHQLQRHAFASMINPAFKRTFQ